MDNQNVLETRLEKLNSEIISLEKYIDSCPDGKLLMRKKSDNSFYYYVKKKDGDGKVREHYLNQEQMPLAVALAKKEYAIACREDKKKEKWYIEHFLRLENRVPQAEQLLQTKPGIAQLVIPTLRNYDDYASDWQNADYERSRLYAEHLTVPTVLPDLFVRSKSESMYVYCLVKYGVPFRYEETIRFGNTELHPDFTCMNPRTHEIFYLEHYGRMDDPAYMAEQHRREELYRKSGIYLWKNLLVTTETNERPLDIRWLENIIEYYLI